MREEYSAKIQEMEGELAATHAQHNDVLQAGGDKNEAHKSVKDLSLNTHVTICSGASEIAKEASRTTKAADNIPVRYVAENLFEPLIATSGKLKQHNSLAKKHQPVSTRVCAARVQHYRCYLLLPGACEGCSLAERSGQDQAAAGNSCTENRKQERQAPGLDAGKKQRNQKGASLIVVCGALCNLWFVRSSPSVRNTPRPQMTKDARLTKIELKNIKSAYDKQSKALQVKSSKVEFRTASPDPHVFYCHAGRRTQQTVASGTRPDAASTQAPPNAKKAAANSQVECG
jgi:hypothetical protein